MKPITPSLSRMKTRTFIATMVLLSALPMALPAAQYGDFICTTNATLIVDASTNLATDAWSPVATNTLIDGWSYFADRDFTNHPTRF